MTITTARLSVYVALVLFGLLHCGSGLSILQSPSRTSSAARNSGARLSFSLSLVKDGGNSNVNSDFPPEEELTAEYKGSVDWDAEWKKVVQSGGSVKTSTTTGGAERPGKDFYKSEAEIAAIRAANKATESAAKLASQVPTMPSFDSLKGDWKFWIGILAVLSFGTALLTAQLPVTPPSGGGGGGPGSYYI